MVVDDSIKLAQLEDIKATWDPTNTFHHCQVIASKPVGFYQSLLRKALNSNNNNLVFIASISNPGKKVIFSCTLLFSPMETTTIKTQIKDLWRTRSNMKSQQSLELCVLDSSYMGTVGYIKEIFLIVSDEINTSLIMMRE